MADFTSKSKGVSLAKGPVLIVGIAGIAFGLLALIVGEANGFKANIPDGTISGKKFLGLEVNGWSSLLFVAAGLLLVFGAPLHWGAKSMSIIVGLVLGAASVIAIVDGDDVFGIFAANGLTELVWGAAATLLLILALLPRVGGGKDTDHDRDDRVALRRATRAPSRRCPTPTGPPPREAPPAATSASAED